MLAVVQLDAMVKAVVDRMLAAGELPALASLHARGTLTRLTSPARALEGGTSHTLYSGAGVPEHGLYFPLQWSAAEQRVRPAYAFEHPEPVWERLDRAGRRCLVLDPYQCAPSRAQRSLILSGWQYRNRVTNRVWSAPEGAGRSLERRFGKGPPVEETFGRVSPQELSAIGERLAASPARAAAVATEALREAEYDLVWVNLPGVHLAGHRFLEVSGVSGEPDLDARERPGRMLERIYAAADTALGRVVDALPNDADVIVVSPLGMGPETSRSHLLPGMLAAVLDGGAKAGDDLISRLRTRLPTGFRAALARPLPDRVAAALAARMSLSNLDWSRTRAFALPSNHEGCIRFNLRGRERDGIVDPAETKELAETIAAGLATFTDDEGAAVVTGVYTPTERLGEGSRSHLLPDLVVEWSERPVARRDGVRSPSFGEVRGAASDGRTGGHTPEAWALLVPARAHVRAPSRPADVADVAATVWALLGDGAAEHEGEPLLSP